MLNGKNNEEAIMADEILELEKFDEILTKPREQKLGILSKRTSSQMKGGDTHFKVNIAGEKMSVKR